MNTYKQSSGQIVLLLWIIAQAQTLVGNRGNRNYANIHYTIDTKYIISVYLQRQLQPTELQVARPKPVTWEILNSQIGHFLFKKLKILMIKNNISVLIFFFFP